MRSLKFVALALFGTCVLTLSGCARTATETVVADDGSWTRTLKFTIPKEAQMGGEKPKFEENFVLPSGTWKVSRAEEKENQVFTASRSAKLGETISRDIQIKTKKGIVCVNEVAVTQIAPGRYEYKETIKYVGTEKPDAAAATAWLRPIIKEGLPPNVDSAALDRLTQGMFVEMWHIIFGPSEPLLSQLLLSPDLAERRLKNRFGKALEGLLATELGDKADADMRRKIVRAMIAKLDSDKLLEGPKEKQKEGPSQDSNLVSMFASVKLPGKIVETNGEVDELSGEVYWALYPEAAQLGPVVLRAVCQVGP